MGQCGCGDFSGEFTLPAPDGGLYVFWRHHPCLDCDTPAGLVVCHLKTPEDIETWEADRLPTLKNPNGERLIPVLDMTSLAIACDDVAVAEIWDDGDGYETIGNYLRDDGHRVVTEAMCNGSPDWEQW